MICSFGDNLSPLPPPGRNTPLLTLVWQKHAGHRVFDARAAVRSMLELAIGPYGSEALVGGDSALSWGLLVPDDPSPLTAWSVAAGPKDLCLFEGELYDDPPGLERSSGNEPRLSQYTAEQMRKNPWGELSGLNGVYSGLYMDHIRRDVYLLADDRGTRPLYWYSDNNCLIVSNSLWAFRGCSLLNRTCDPMTLAETMTIGFPLQGRTWISGVRLLQPGHRVRSSAEGTAEVRRVVRPLQREDWSFQQTVSELRTATDQTIARLCSRLQGPAVLGLSGGLDSRICLAALHARQLPHTSLTFCSDPAEADNRLAVSAAGLLGEPHATVVLDGQLAVSLYRDLRIINEGESPGFGFFFLAAAAQQYGSGLLIGSEAIRDTPMGALRVQGIRKRSTLAQDMLTGQMDRFSPAAALGLLAPAYHVTWQEVLDEWQDSFARIPDQPMVDIYLDHLLENRIHRRTRPRLDAARWFCQPVYPYMDNQLYRIFRSIPLEHLTDERAHIALLSDYRSGLELLPNAARHQAGIPLGREYACRHLVRLARTLRRTVLLPLDRARQSLTGRSSRAAWYQRIMKNETERLHSCGLFAPEQLQRVIAGAARGSFIPRNGLHSLLSAAVVHDVLFGGGLAGRRALRFIHTSHTAGQQPAAAQP